VSSLWWLGGVVDLSLLTLATSGASTPPDSVGVSTAPYFCGKEFQQLLLFVCMKRVLQVAFKREFSKGSALLSVITHCREMYT
jgi:hypothetical protein